MTNRIKTIGRGEPTAVDREALRLRDRRLPVGIGSIPAHDYCVTPSGDEADQLLHRRLAAHTVAGRALPIAKRRTSPVHRVAASA